MKFVNLLKIENCLLKISAVLILLFLIGIKTADASVLTRPPNNLGLPR